MKRIFRLGILMGVLMVATGCVLGLQTNKIPVNIGFMPVIGHDTRADVEESVPFPESRSFKVWATDTDNGSTILDNETISHGAGGWLASRIWPDSEISFTAYWPTDITPEYDKELGIIIRGFNANADPRDLLVARNRAEYEADSLVTLNFEHILSRVDFRVKHALNDDIEVIVERIEMVGYGFTGDYNTNGNGQWKVTSQKDSYVIFDAGEGEGFRLTDNAEYIGEDFYVIPQVCKADVIMNCRIRIGEGGWIPEKVNVGSLNTEWQSGKQYTYTLNLTDTRLLYTTGISNWNNRE